MKEEQNIFFSKENITFFIAVIGFLLSLWNFIKDLWCNRSKINIRLKKQPPIISLDERGLRIELLIENKSRIPVSISRMFLIYNNVEYEFEWIPRLFSYDELKTIDNHSEITKISTLSLPATIPGLGVYGGNFIVIINEDFYNDIKNNYSIKIQTKRKSFIFYPPEEYHTNDEKKLYYH